MKTFLVLLGLAVALVGVGAVLNPLKAVALARAIGAFFLERIRAVVEWARDPKRDWWKIGCLSFGGLFLVAAMYAENRRREVLIVTERCETVTTTLKTELVTVRTTGDLDRADLATCRTFMQAVADGRQDVESENREALLALEREARAADARAAEWKRRYDNKAPSCTAALAALEGPCAEFADY